MAGAGTEGWTTRLTRALHRQLAAPRALAWIVALGVLLHLPVLGVGLVADDHVHALALDAPFDGLSGWNLYDFGGVERSPEAWRRGGLPWWTSDGMRVRFWRPVPSLMRALDHRIAGGAAWPGHVLNLALFALLLVVVHRFVRRLGLGAAAAALAVLLFAVDESSTLPVGWLANRNSLLEALFGVTALAVVLGDRPSAPWKRGLLATAFAALALLSKESGIVFLALAPLFAWWRARRDASSAHNAAWVWSAASSALVAAAFVVGYVALGYGADSRFYPEPWSDPPAALARIVALTGVAAVSLSSPFPADLVFLEPRATWPIAALGLAVIAAFASAARRQEARASETPWSAAWPLLVFFIATLAPQAAAPPGDRTLFVPAIAFAALAARVVAAAWERAVHARRALPTPAWVWLALAVPLSAGGLLARIGAFSTLAAESRGVAATLTPSPETRHAIVLQGPHGLALLALAAAWPREHAGSAELTLHPLQLGRRALALERPDARTLLVESLDEPFLAAPMEAVFLTETDRPHEGRIWRAPLFTVEALDAAPHRLLLRFPESPEALAIELFRADGAETTRVPWPKVGERRELAATRSAVPLAP